MNRKEIFKKLEKESTKKFAPNGKWLIKPMEPGFSGAQVLKAELIQNGHAALIDGGQYILKLCGEDNWGGQAESERYRIAKAIFDQNDPSFAQKHIPKLYDPYLIEIERRKYYALLMEVAGHSFDMYENTEGIQNRKFKAAAQKIVEQFLEAGTYENPEVELIKPHQYLENWLGYRLEEIKAENLHRYVRDMTGDRLVFSLGGETLLNPVKLFSLLKDNAESLEERRPLKGILHGDLHGGNIFIHNVQPVEEPFQIIDFGLSTEGYIGFDQAYLEIANCIYNMRDLDPMLLITVLKSLDTGNDSLPLTSGNRGSWLHECLFNLRKGWRSWQEKKHGTRTDDLNRQMLLARIAAGLNWVNKPINPGEKVLSLAYAAWAARHYIESREKNIWRMIITGRGATVGFDEDTPRPIKSPDPETTDLWRMLWAQLEGFSNPGICYVLVAGPQENTPELQAYGNIPWSVVIDLDPYSENDGLYKAATPVIKTRRGLHVLSDTSSISEFQNATYWFLTAGWPSKGEKALDYWQWLEKKVPIIGRIFNKLKKSYGSKNIVIMFVPSFTNGMDKNMDRFDDIANHAFTALGAEAKIILTGNQRLNRDYPTVTSIPISPNAILPALANSFGITPSQIKYEIPSVDGMVSIPIDKLRMLQENFTVMHSAIIDEEIHPDQDENSGFWRGNPPTWHEINARIDIYRKTTSEIKKKVGEFFENPPSRTVFVTQKPGMGGTTILRRVAWDLHKIYPIVIVNKDARSLTEKLKIFHEIAGCPVLIIVESDCLTEARFEEIYSTAFNENIRSVFIYLRKDFSNHSYEAEEKADSLSLPEPLSDKEAELFYNSFKKLTKENTRHKELSKITHIEGYYQYRIPFFYGLITFDRDFIGIEQFVHQHLQGLHPRLIGLFQFLGLVTRYSSEGLSVTFVKSILRLDQKIKLDNVLPEGPFRLISINNNRLRLLHPLIAEQTLEAIDPGGKNGKWIQSLYLISLYLVDSLHEYSPEINSEIQELLIALFINRQGLPSIPTERTFRKDIGKKDKGKPSHRDIKVEDDLDIVAEDEKDGFSPVIMKMISIHKHQARQVFDKLVELYPEDPHLWNHRGRYYMYKIKDLAEAEKSLIEAVKRSEGQDHIHYHTYGLVKKSQVRRLLWKIREKKTPFELFQIIKSDYIEAEKAFQKARDLNPENAYAYIGGIDLIINTLSQIKYISGVQSLSHDDSDSQNLIMDWIGQANTLLDSINQIYLSSPKQKTILIEIEAKLKELYGDFEGVIQIWEKAVSSGPVNSNCLRALCKAYLDRKDGKWEKLERAELKRICRICEDNLYGPNWRDNDVLHWFQASIRLKDADRNDMIAKLCDWQSNSLWSVHYILSILYFLEWVSGSEDAKDDFFESIKKSRELIYGRKRFCRFYFGNDQNFFSIVDVTSLQKEKKGYWFTDDSMLKRMYGLISEDLPSNDRHPTVVIEGIFNVPFFNDGTFKKYSDENAEVSFYIGFCPMGLRAFKVEKSSFPEDYKRTLANNMFSTVTSDSIREEPADPIWVEEQLKKLKIDQVKLIAEGIVSAREKWGVQTILSELQDIVEATLGLENIAQLLEFENFEKLLKSYKIFTFETHHDYCYVNTINAQNKQAYDELNCSGKQPHKKLKGTVVKFYPEKNFGFIEELEKKDPNSHDYYFRYSDLSSEVKEKIKRFDIVLFSPATNNDGLLAEEITLFEGEINDSTPIGIRTIKK